MKQLTLPMTDITHNKNVFQMKQLTLPMLKRR